jgi:rod shape-determining protein MreC
LLVLSLLSVVLMTVWAREGTAGPLHTARSGVEFVAAPVKSAGAVLTTPLRAVGDFFGNITTSSATVAELRAQNETLQSQAIRQEEYRQENERLTQLLDLKEAYNLESVGARVISVSSDTWNQTITVNKGSLAGISAGMPVLSANGLIGQIETVSFYSSTVRLITDEVSGVAVFLQSSRAEGVLSGSIDGSLSLEFIPLDVPVAVGDPVITSGAGGVFPKGIPLGEVSFVDFAAADVYQKILVRPITRVATYEEVLILIGSEAEIVPSAQEGGAEGGAEQANGAGATNGANDTGKTGGDQTGSGGSS